MSSERSITPTPYIASPDGSGSGSDENDGTWFPGDGICPSTSQFDEVCQATYEKWKSAKLQVTQRSDFDSLSFQVKSFLDLLQDVPLFFHNPPEDIDLQNNVSLTLHSSLYLGTTENSTCDQSRKSIDYFQYLGFSKPVTFRQTESPSSLTNIILAWSYIFSSRWVEILQQFGVKSSLTHIQDEHLSTHFWTLVTKSYWEARVENDTQIFYAPWMLRKGDDEVGERYNMIHVQPNSYSAFDTLVQFCTSKGLEEELFVGLVAILMITSPEVRPLTLGVPIEVHGSTSSTRRLKDYERLFESIDKCISLSSMPGAFDSLLCSVFFEPDVPCNLLGAKSLGFKEALLPIDGDYQTLIEAISEKKPHLALLWRGALHTSQAIPLLNIAMKDLPPICLVASFWTNTIQSFLQVSYESQELEQCSILRSHEFSTSYFCRSEAPVPWSAAPPFGSTMTNNLSIEVQRHYNHDHKPLWWMSHWKLCSGKRVPATSQKRISPVFIRFSRNMQDGHPQHQHQQFPSYQRHKIADQQSRSATSRLFNWHRIYDDGLWLDDGTSQTVETIRKIQQHPWITDFWDDDEDIDVSTQSVPSSPDREMIDQWRAKVEECSRGLYL